MNAEALKRGAQLDEEMRIINAALNNLANAKVEPHWCVLSKHRDGSGWQADLIGANVAKDVVDAVYAELQNQLALREEEFAKL